MSSGIEPEYIKRFDQYVIRLTAIARPASAYSILDGTTSWRKDYNKFVAQKLMAESLDDDLFRQVYQLYLHHKKKFPTACQRQLTAIRNEAVMLSLILTPPNQE